MIDRLHDGRITEDSRLGHWAFSICWGGGRGDGILKLLTQEGRENTFMKLRCSVLLREGCPHPKVSWSQPEPHCTLLLFVFIPLISDIIW